MCELCNKAEEEYPDLGEGAFLEIKDGVTWVSIDPKHGVRIAQKRTVTYAGPEGVVEREETGFVYIRWDDLEDMILHMIAAEVGKQVIERHNNDDQTGN